MNGLLNTFSKTLHALSSVAIIAALLALLVTSSESNNQNSAILRGDFPAFYSAAVLAADSPDKLYSPEAQRAIQNKFWPGLEGNYLHFAYPPYVAAMLSPFSSLSPHTSKAVWSFLSVVAILVASILNVKMLEERTLITQVAALLCFGPIFIGVFGGQNVAFSVLCFSMLLYAIHNKPKHWEIIAGLGVGFWLFKPNFSLVFLAFLFASRHYKASVVAVSVGIAYFLLGAAYFGFDWPLVWYETVRFFSEKDLVVNGYQMISIPGVFQTFAAYYFDSSFIRNAITVVAYLFSLILFVSIFVRLRKSPYAERRFALFLAAAPIALLISPHTLFYDFGIAAVSISYYIHIRRTKQLVSLLMSYTLIFIILAYKSEFYVQPLFLLAMWSCAYTLRKLRSKYPQRA